MALLIRSNSTDEQLYQSCKDGNVNRVKLLLQLGASANTQDLDREYHISTLAAAALQNLTKSNKKQREIVALLLDSGADPRICTKSGMNLLHYCSQYSQDAKMLKLILQHPKSNANVQNMNGDTPLHLLCKYETESEVAILKAEHLINFGANPMLLNSRRESPLCYVSYKAKVKLLATLLSSKRINPNGDPLAQNIPVDNVAKGYVHHGGSENHFSQYYKCIDLLLKKGANINITRLSGFNPLHYTIKFRSFAMTKFLLTRNADPNTVDINGHNSLSFAYMFSTTLISDLGDIDKILIDAGANTNSRTRSGSVPISYLQCTLSAPSDVNRSLWWEKVKYNFQAGLNPANLDISSVVRKKIDTLPVCCGWYSDIVLLHNCGFHFNLKETESIPIAEKHIKFVKSIQRQPVNLQQLAGRVIRQTLKPNAVKGTKLLNPPKCIANIITLGYLG